MIDRRLITNFDWVMLGLVLALAGLGIVNLYSAASSFDGAGPPIYLKQLYWTGVGLVAMLFMAVMGYQRLAGVSWLLYLVVVGLLAAVLLWGRVVGGSQRWLALGPVLLQPSELSRLAVILVLATYFQRREQDGPAGLKQLIFPCLLMMVPAVLILKEPDLGTALMLIIVAGSVILANGVKVGTLLFSGGGLLLALPIAWRFMKDYQKKRIFSFLDPESDPLGASYHLIQSKIAVGSGGLTGKGFLAGTQTQLQFLPEQHTDFAFSVLAEEWGFVGAVVILSLFAALVMRGLMHSLRAKDRMGMLVIVGCTACIFWPMVINVGMVLGLMPVVGIPLPFISYGGSHLVSNMAAVGLLQSVCMRRYVFHRP